jgi:thiol-disulfide isomerase/thioredoxin
MSSGLLFLSSEDFNIQNGTKGQIMCTSIPGFSLILFYSTFCEHCQKLIPIFKNLPGTIGGCQFGMINVSTDRQCVKMSANTVAPVTYVPYIVLYVEGKPFMIYKGEHSMESIKKFFFDVADNLQKKQTFAQHPPQRNVNQNATISANAQVPQGIPEYSIGKPICGGKENVCYLEFDTKNGYISK